MELQNPLLLSIIGGIQEKKGHNIKVADLRGIDETICEYLVICDANSPSHVSAISDSVYDFTLKDLLEKPRSIDGVRNSLWVAMDYTDVIVHIFLPESREFYDLDHLWEDATIHEIPDLL